MTRGWIHLSAFLAPLLPAATLLARDDSLKTVTPLEATQIAQLRPLLHDAREGGGAEVSSLVLIQSHFQDSGCALKDCADACNAVILLWNETGPQSAGIDVFIDDVLLSRIAGLPAGESPGASGLEVAGIEAGGHTFRVQSLGDFASIEGTITILDEQPFADVTAVGCAEVDAGGAGASSRVRVTVGSSPPLPEFFLVSLDGEVIGELDSAESEFTVDQVAPGERCFALQGVQSESASIFYRGCAVESCCVVGGGVSASYIPGICNGSDSLDLTAAVFSLNFLFLGGDTPPCKKACECNSDGDFDLSDGVCVLRFLFLGDDPPVGWVNREPTCVPVNPGDDCKTPSAACRG